MVLVGRLVRLPQAAGVAPYVALRGLASRCSKNEKCADTQAHDQRPGRSLLLGARQNANRVTLTSAEPNGLELDRMLQLANMKGKQGEVRLFPFSRPDAVYQQVAVAGMGEDGSDDDGVEPLAEAVRNAVAVGVQALRTHGAQNVTVDCMGHAQAAGEGAALGLYRFDRLKSADKRSKTLDCMPWQEADSPAFARGVRLGQAQNLARELMETPSNLLTPTLFAARAKEDLEGPHANNITVTVHDEHWARARGMGAFLGVAQGTEQPLRFLEIEYVSGVAKDTPPLVLVGKGITFDSGGISLKPSEGMAMMRGDMGGAANVVGAIKGLASIGAPGRVVGLVPLCENMPSGRALKPGDVVTASNHLTIEVDNTDAEGRLVLADSLVYAREAYTPRAVLSIATLTGAIDVALGQAATGVFTQSNELWAALESAGHRAGERLWRMPVYKHYDIQLESDYADLNNTGGRSAGSCTAAAFLRRFVDMKEYAHLDIAGVMHAKGPKPGMACAYLGKGMQGRPVRALIEYALSLEK